MTNTIVVTGSSSGIGRATAKLFAHHGWNVVATMRNPADAGKLATLPNVLVLALDVTNQQNITQAITDSLKRFGRIDALVNNAGYGQYGIFEAIPQEKIEQQFAVNVFGVMNMIRTVLPHFRANHAGTIVNISSGAGIFTLPMTSLYSASKFALEGFSESLAYELASQNIRVKLVEPHGGVTSTNFGQRSANDLALDPTLTDYNDFVMRSQTAFASMSNARSINSDDVAQIIWQAVTDSSDQLRYLIGNDERGFIKARRELSDQAYIDYMRAFFQHYGSDQNNSKTS